MNGHSSALLGSRVIGLVMLKSRSVIRERMRDTFAQASSLRAITVGLHRGTSGGDVVFPGRSPYVIDLITRKFIVEIWRRLINMHDLLGFHTYIR